eukprot:TRINITY_DN872_c0_g1_i3.p1 TRINITY_DN872_c0_g1~~TRINITY_DN872_c0_g1_i3.p1  ORF type:complete len:601 (+),score=91.45 TRINITY_DN872_c0_g1_i3:1148-2950(+)
MKSTTPSTFARLCVSLLFVHTFLGAAQSKSLTSWRGASRHLSSSADFVSLETSNVRHVGVVNPDELLLKANQLEFTKAGDLLQVLENAPGGTPSPVATTETIDQSTVSQVGSDESQVETTEDPGAVAQTQVKSTEGQEVATETESWRQLKSIGKRGRYMRSSAAKGFPSMPNGASWWNALHSAYAATAAKTASVDILFAGDSLIEGWNGTFSGKVQKRYGDSRQVFQDMTAALGASVKAFGIAGDKVRNLRWRFQNGELPSSFKVSVLALSVGVNDVLSGHMTPLQTALQVDGLVQWVRTNHPETVVVVLGLLPESYPVGDNKLQPYPLETNHNISTLISSEGQYVQFKGCFPSFLTASGDLNTDLYIKDNFKLLHLSAQGYRAWASCLEPALTSALALSKVLASTPGIDFQVSAHRSPPPPPPRRRPSKNYPPPPKKKKHHHAASPPPPPPPHKKKHHPPSHSPPKHKHKSSVSPPSSHKAVHKKKRPRSPPPVKRAQSALPQKKDMTETYHSPPPSFYARHHHHPLNSNHVDASFFDLSTSSSSASASLSSSFLPSFSMSFTGQPPLSETAPPSLTSNEYIEYAYEYSVGDEYKHRRF